MIDFFIQDVSAELTEEAVEYGVAFGGSFVLLWLVFAKTLRHRKIQEHRRAGPKQWAQEVLWSMIAELGGLFLGLSLLWTDSVQPLLDASASHWLVSAVGLFAILAIIDTWFYWLHRGVERQAPAVDPRRDETPGMAVPGARRPHRQTERK